MGDDRRGGEESGENEFEHREGGCSCENELARKDVRGRETKSSSAPGSGRAESSAARDV
jgi:hypothetical protein